MGENWKWLAKIFAVFGVMVGLLGIGTFSQINGITSAVNNFFDANNAWTVLYLMARRHSEYFVAVPTVAATIIQKSAPGPPATIAVATPTMLPVPIVAERAVHNAPKLEISPCSLSVSFENIYLKARISLRT